MAAPCPDHKPERQAWFGDLHVHTRYSQDANWRMGASRAGPDEAYRFARGEPLSLPPFDESGHSVRSLQLTRPLDFAMVADHAENMDIVRLCDTPDSPHADAWLCRANPIAVLAAQFLGRALPGLDVPCATASPECQAASRAVWTDTVAAARRHQQDCQFSAFAGYEWSGMAGAGNLHRNVVFRSTDVPPVPISAIQEPTVEGLWRQLDLLCTAAGGCEAITIPHNSNLSGGQMFSPLMGNGEAMSNAVAAQRARYERLAEIVQHKGASECWSGQGADEACAFEQLPYSSFTGKYFKALREGPENDSRYLREALREGIRLRAALGHNPFVTGFIGSTDTHIGAAGAVAESDYPGHHGAQHITGDGSTPQLPDRIEQNPGGLAVLYAEHNTRSALFAAMRRREAYATSGTRIGLRFFAGEALPEDLCERPDLVSQGYAGGVPMGGELTARAGMSAPVFLVAADADPVRPGADLQRIQLIKGWVDEAGQSRETVIELAGDAPGQASVNLADCSPTGHGHRQLCGTWRDPDFDPQQDAFYYARVLENPSCRWQQRICTASRVSCADPEALPDTLRACCDASVPPTIQERAWSSPIWIRSDPLTPSG